MNLDRPVDGRQEEQQGAFQRHRGLLFAVAYRLLGTAADAEDAVQDTWLKWSAADRSQVADAKAYLTRIVTNLALEKLRSAQRRRETYVGPWLPEPVLTGGPDTPAAAHGTAVMPGTAVTPDTAETVATAESVSIAMLVVLETLSPLERAVFVLKDVFGFSHAEIAEAVDRTESAVRQAAHRAREHVRAGRPRFPADRARQREVTERFLAAASGGDVNALMELLSPDVTLWTDGGGKVRQALRPVVGARKVAAWFAGVATRPYEGVHPSEMRVDLVELNGAPGLVFTGGGRVVSTLTLDVAADGRVVAVHNVANPEKLRAVAEGTTHDLGPA